MRVVIPVKPFAEAKQRLAPVLGAAERAELAERMFRHVLRTASTVFGAPEVFVISRSREVLAIAEAARAPAMLETGRHDLNAALLQAARDADRAGNSTLLIVAGDLPLLEESDLKDLARYDCAIAPDRHEQGTNALLWPADLTFAFGENSLMRHRAVAVKAGLDPQIVLRRGLAYDVDVADDLVAIYPNLARSSGSTRSA